MFIKVNNGRIMNDFHDLLYNFQHLNVNSYYSYVFSVFSSHIHAIIIYIIKSITQCVG